MRVMLILRLYTGFEAALAQRRPVFSGTPAIANLIEGLIQAGHTVRIVFARRAGPLAWREARDVDVTIPGLAAQITVLAGEDRFASMPGFIRRRLAYWRHLWPMYRAAASFSPDLIYVDRGHLIAAAFFARLGRVPVVWRVLGVPDTLREVLAWRGPRAWIWRWLLRSRFAGVICSIEGSGGKAWLARALRDGVPRHFFFGGRPVLGDERPALPHLPAAETRVVFVGRLEASKGCEEFIAAVVLASRQVTDLHALVVGSGSLAAALSKQVALAGVADRVTFTGSVDHRTAVAVVGQADIYVSLNQTGNLSNANLEALTAGLCMIIPTSDPATGVDLDTDELLPADTAFRFGKFNEVERLAGAIVHFHKHPEERRMFAARAKAWALSHLDPWNERIAKEIRVLENLAADSGCDPGRRPL